MVISTAGDFYWLGFTILEIEIAGELCCWGFSVLGISSDGDFYCWGCLMLFLLMGIHIEVIGCCPIRKKDDSAVPKIKKPTKKQLKKKEKQVFFCPSADYEETPESGGSTLSQTINPKTQKPQTIHPKHPTPQTKRALHQKS